MSLLSNLRPFGKLLALESLSEVFELQQNWMIKENIIII